MKYFVLNHAPYGWHIPFDIIEIGLGGYIPKPGIRASTYIGDFLDSEVAFGGLRSCAAVRATLASCDPTESVFLGSYRMFMGKQLEENWRIAMPQEVARQIVSPQVFEENFESLVALELPQNIDVLICTPINFGYSVIQHYSASHHLDDLMLAFSCAIRAGLVTQAAASAFLTGTTLIPYGFFASSAKLRMDLFERLQWCATEFFYKHYVPRDGYQRRAIDFAFERVIATYLFELVHKEGIRTAASKPILVSPTGNYEKTL